MPLVYIYIGLLICIISLYFVKKEWPINYKKGLTYVHLLSFVILLADIFLIVKFDSSFRSLYSDRIIAMTFFISGSLTFALYRKTLKRLTKIYFGFFFFYPLIAASTFLIDRIFFILVASPLIVTLITPTVYYSDGNYDIRGMQGIMAPSRLVLIKKNVLTEIEIGISDEELKGSGGYKNFKLLVSNKDSTLVTVDIEGQKSNLTFRK